MCVYVYVYLRMCVYIYIYIHTHIITYYSYYVILCVCTYIYIYICIMFACRRAATRQRAVDEMPPTLPRAVPRPSRTFPTYVEDEMPPTLLLTFPTFPSSYRRRWDASYPTSKYARSHTFRRCKIRAGRPAAAELLKSPRPYDNDNNDDTNNNSTNNVNDKHNIISQSSMKTNEQPFERHPPATWKHDLIGVDMVLAQYPQNTLYHRIYIIHDWF